MLKHLKIRQRVLLIFLSVALTGSLLQLVVAGLQIQTATYDSHRQQLEISSLSLASSLSDPFEHDDSEGIQSVVSSFQSSNSFSILVLDSQRSFLPSQPTDVMPTQLPTWNDGITQADFIVDQSNVERLYVTTPVLYEGDTYGYVMLSQPTSIINQEVTQQWTQLSFATLIIIILVIIASLWLASTISNPIQQLEKGALKMADGYLDTRITLNSQDEIGQLGNTFNYMAEQIDDLLKVQRSFVSNAAHELRTPLMSLALRVEALEGDTLSQDERATYLKDIHQEINHMTQLVTGLLNLARIDEGRIQQTELISDLPATLKDISRHWRIASTKAGLTFEAHIPDTLPTIPLPQNDLRLICDNLLGNAIKYTRDGEVTFYVETSDNQLQLRVTDTGIGFTKEQAENLFDRFYRTDLARANFVGTGLGLSLIESLLEHYNGKIEAYSEGLDKGAMFTVTIPTKKP